MTEDSRAAFERLCREQYASLVRTAYLITGDREEALDLAQEALARAYERWRTVSRLDRPGAWLHRVVANLAISWRRRQRVRTRVGPARATGVEPADPADPELLAALRALPPAQRAAVILRFYADLSVEDTAKALGKRPGTITAQTAQAMKRLRGQLAREDADDEVRG